MAHLNEFEVFMKTLYGEARGEETEGIEWVAWVIKNRARMNRAYWGGDTIKGVCLKDKQFECWNGKDDIIMNVPDEHQKVCDVAERLYKAPSRQDPTGGADHYNNPDKEGYPDWTKNCKKLRKIGGHQFYKGP